MIKGKNSLMLLLFCNITATVHFPTRVQNEFNMSVDYIFIDNYKFTKYTVSPIYNGLSDHDARLLTITNYMELSTTREATRC
jgi:hypothetical protein